MTTAVKEAGPAPADWSNICHVPECHVTIESGKVMCSIHWSYVPRPLQHKVLEAYKLDAAGKHEPTADWLGAIQECITSVAKTIEGFKGEPRA